jgi:uncharacterized glyoxalase superfamily protein PhnB
MAILPILAVKDYDASVKFYTEKLGFTSEMTMQGPDGSNVFGFVGYGKETQVGLSRDEKLIERGNGVVLMIYPSGEFDIDAFYEQVKKNGVSITEELKTEYWGDRVFSVKDPDGYYLTFGKTVQTVPMDEIQDHMRQNG